ncbi:MAG: hypothetical protein GQ527_11440 [Bacteroidales bacterium]|nr:hypothetical protein [Bacteroidales bacterium]
MNIQQLKSYAAATLINRKGKSVADKYVIIESDDWGAIRTPSIEALNAFKEKGLDLSKSIYKVDALASKDDLEQLFEVLKKYKGSNGKPAKITANAIMANPDFQKIKESNFKEFHYEKFTETFKRYPSHKNNLEVWKKGIDEGVFKPQFHGREHLNYKRWLQVLQSNNEAAHFCFDWNATCSGKDDYSFMEAYDWDTPEDISEQKLVVKEGIKIFKDTFGEDSKSFIAPCYNWDPQLEKTLQENGVEWIQGIRNQYIPTGKFNEYTPLQHSFGEANIDGVRYNLRNCFFEPSMNPAKDWVQSCLAQVTSAFHWNKPAVICSHRINYIGFIDKKNSDRGLKDLEQLLAAIVKKWPEVQFISTDELTEVI